MESFTIEAGAFILGAFLLLIAIAGGNFRLFGAELSDKVANPYLRFLAGLFGAALISVVLVPIFKDSVANPESPVATLPSVVSLTPTVQPTPATVIPTADTVAPSAVPTDSPAPATTQGPGSTMPPGEISFGDSIPCEIKKPGDKPEYTFSANAGDEVQVTMRRTGPGLLEPQFQVLGSDGDQVFAGSPREPSRDQAQAKRILPKPGTYTIRVQDASGTNTGACTLQVNRLSQRSSPAP